MLACPFLAILAVQACDGGGEPASVPIAEDAGRDATWVVGDSSSPVDPDDGGSSVRATVAVGGTFACVLAKDGTVWCWGKNDVGQLGQDPAETPSCGAFPCSTVPVKVAGLENVARIALGDDFGCALDLGGRVRCWGSNAKGQLAARGIQSSFEPRGVVVGAKDLTAAGAHACALTTDGFVWCWGENTCGMFGEPGAVENAPVRVVLPPMAQISIGPDAMCVTGVDGRVLCWGADHRGSLGHDLQPDASECDGVPFDRVPRSVQVLDTELPITGVSDVHVGSGVVCARLADGKVSCWGDNERGALGRGSADSLPHPRAAEVPGLVAERLEVSGQTPCAITGGRLMCWGDGSFGRLGPLEADAGCGDHLCRASAFPIPGMMPVRDVASGPGSIAAIKEDVTVWMWGRNAFGELGLLPDDPANVDCDGERCVPEPRRLEGLPPLD